MRRQMEISREINEAKVGKIMEVMVEEHEAEGAYRGRNLL